MYVVDDLLSLQKAKSILENIQARAEMQWQRGIPEICGLDVEWRPAIYQMYQSSSSAEEGQQDLKEGEGEGGGEGEEEGGVDAQTKTHTSSHTPAAPAFRERASILQIATREEVFLMDLCALCRDDADADNEKNPNHHTHTHKDTHTHVQPPFDDTITTPSPTDTHTHTHTQSSLCALFDATLTPLFRHPYVLKLGFGFASDKKILCQSYTHIQAFKCVCALLELGDLGVPGRGVFHHAESRKGERRGVGVGVGVCMSSFASLSWGAGVSVRGEEEGEEGEEGGGKEDGGKCVVEESVVVEVEEEKKGGKGRWERGGGGGGGGGG